MYFVRDRLFFYLRFPPSFTLILHSGPRVSLLGIQFNAVPLAAAAPAKIDISTEKGIINLAEIN